MRIPIAKETLARNTLKIGRGSLSVKSALRELGIRSSKWPKKGVSWKTTKGNGRGFTFWEGQSDLELYDLLHAARAAYRKQMKLVHEDNGGSHRKATRLNAVWAFTRKQFAKRGFELL